MSIETLKVELRDVPNSHTLTMRYEDGGKIQVFQAGEKEVRLPGDMKTPQIQIELRKAL